jgi:hypothetical protein
MTADEVVGLADVIRQVRRELTVAREEGEEQDIRFSVQKVHLEFAVQVHRAGDGRAGLRIGVVTAELGGAVAKDTTHRVQVELAPEDEHGMIRVGRHPRTDGGH